MLIEFPKKPKPRRMPTLTQIEAGLSLAFFASVAAATVFGIVAVLLQAAATEAVEAFATVKYLGNIGK